MKYSYLNYGQSFQILSLFLDAVWLLPDTVFIISVSGFITRIYVAMRPFVMLSNVEFIRKLVEAVTLGMFQRNQVLISAWGTDYRLFCSRTSGRGIPGWYGKVG
jgi:hypothetical protein